MRRLERRSADASAACCGSLQGKGQPKLAREGILPPLLLWWVSGLDGWLLLDGHARLAAALTEGLLPPMVELSLAPSPGQIDEQIALVMRKDSLIADQLEGDRQAGRPAADSAARAHQWHFRAVYAAIPSHLERTRAWPLRNGLPAWQEAAAAAAPPDWPTDSDDVGERLPPGSDPPTD